MADTNTSTLLSMANAHTVERAMGANLKGLRHEVGTWAEAMEEAALNVLTLLDMASGDTDPDKSRALVAASSVLVRELMENHGRLTSYCDVMLQRLAAKEVAHG